MATSTLLMNAISVFYPPDPRSFHLPWPSLIVTWSSFKKTCICCERKKRDTEKIASKVLNEEYRKLGPLSYPECNVLFCFILLIILWFSRDPGFMPGWLSLAWSEGKTK